MGFKYMHLTRARRLTEMLAASERSNKIAYSRKPIVSNYSDEQHRDDCWGGKHVRRSCLLKNGCRARILWSSGKWVFMTDKAIYYLGITA